MVPSPSVFGKAHLDKSRFYFSWHLKYFYLRLTKFEIEDAHCFADKLFATLRLIRVTVTML